VTPTEFCYWLQGCLELGAKELNEEQVKIIRDHLDLVFTKVTPKRQAKNDVAETFDNILKKFRDVVPPTTIPVYPVYPQYVPTTTDPWLDLYPKIIC
jgi:uncharacterized protein YjaG (DUF416 family)